MELLTLGRSGAGPVGNFKSEFLVDLITKQDIRRLKNGFFGLESRGSIKNFADLFSEGNPSSEYKE